MPFPNVVRQLPGRIAEKEALCLGPVGGWGPKKLLEAHLKVQAHMEATD